MSDEYRDRPPQSGCCKGCDILHEIEAQADPAGQLRAHVLTRDENQLLRAALEQAEERALKEQAVADAAYAWISQIEEMARKSFSAVARGRKP